MSSLSVLTPRDGELLGALVEKVRLLSQRQIAEHWWGGEVANARRRLRQLTAARLVFPLTVLARPLPILTAPVFGWRPGEPAPNCGSIAHQLQARWKGRPPRHTTAYRATERAAQLLGGRARGELKQPTQATHDLGVAQVWLLLCRTAPDWAQAWRSEDLLAARRRGDKCPDAFLVNRDEQIVAVIEFGAGYDAQRVRAFHEDCAQRGLPYQLW